jgi:acyl-coenzyme A synthetase/AMP-(fatty) acid ligase
MSRTDAEVDRWLREYARRPMSVAEVLCDRWATDPSRVGLHYEDPGGRAERITFAALREDSLRAAAALQRLGAGRGDWVATLLPKRPELPVATLGLWRLGAVHVPLFTAFGPEAIRFRVQDSGTKGEFVKRRLSAHAYPREVEFVAELPKTPSGKVQRFLLRTRAMPAGARSRQ